MNFVKSFLLYFLFPGVVLGAIYWIGWGSYGNTDINLVLVNKNAGDIGRVSVLAPALTRDFSLLNTGESDVTISKIYTDCACLLVSINKDMTMEGPFGIPVEENTRPIGVAVKKGGKAELTYRFDPKDLNPGLFKATAFIETKDKQITRVPVIAQIVK